LTAWASHWHDSALEARLRSPLEVAAESPAGQLELLAAEGQAEAEGQLPASSIHRLNDKKA